jgi:probable rRNA maturation factor
VSPQGQSAAPAAFPPAAVAIDVAIEADAWTAGPLGTEADLTRLLETAVSAAVAVGELDLPEAAELSVVLTDDARIRVLNKTWRGLDKPTNVLSFPGSDEDDEEIGPLLGDIVVAYETTAREAETEAKRLGDHLTHLVVHGLLHLFGYDHIDDDEAEEMEALETEILAAIGIDDPYADLEPGHRPIDAD